MRTRAFVGITNISAKRNLLNRGFFLFFVLLFFLLFLWPALILLKVDGCLRRVVCEHRIAQPLKLASEPVRYTWPVNPTCWMARFTHLRPCRNAKKTKRSLARRVASASSLTLRGARAMVPRYAGRMARVPGPRALPPPELRFR